MKKDSILVVIPYLAKAAQGNELELAVAGWRKHFKEKFTIVIVGDNNKVVDSGDDIVFIHCQRIPWPGNGKYWAHIDIVNKFLKVRTEFPDAEGFIYTCDDIYAVNDFTLDDVKKPKVRVREIQGSFHSNNAWTVDNYKTKKKLMAQGLPTMNWVCHLPVWYEWDKLIEIYNKYKCFANSYVVEQLYFNTYFADSDFVVIEEEPNSYQIKLWDKNYTVEELGELSQHKIWMCNSMKGWKPELEKFLRGYYGI